MTRVALLRRLLPKVGQPLAAHVKVLGPDLAREPVRVVAVRNDLPALDNAAGNAFVKVDARRDADLRGEHQLHL